MRKRAGLILTILGAVLIVSALLLIVHHQRADRLAGQEAESLLSGVESVISARATQHTAADATQVSVPTEPAEPTLPAELPIVLVDGYECVGYLEIPAIALRLPVMGQCDYALLEHAPCRQYGSSRSDDLVIAAHNYQTHFGRLKELTTGDIICFTDMDGIVNTYEVAQMQTIDPENVDAALNSGFPLVLYTCTTGGQTRVAVYCNRV